MSSDSQAAKKIESEELSSDGLSDDRTVCFCHCVSAAQIKSAIQSGAKTLEMIQAETCASTGCGGCEHEVVELLEAELAQKSKE